MAGISFVPNLLWCLPGSQVVNELAHLTPAPASASYSSDVPSMVPSSLSPTIAPTLKALTHVDFVATSDRNNITNTDLHFVVRITNLLTIATARGELTKTAGFLIVSGTVVKQHADWNPNWSFYLAPGSIFFGEYFIEVCDASVTYLETHLQEAGGSFLPNLQWCPWGSRILSEVGATATPTASPVATPVGTAILSSSERITMSSVCMLLTATIALAPLFLQ
jgi:hypothetical protein